MRKLRRKKNKRQVRIILGTMILVLSVMTVGYAAFSTNLTLNAKGNIIKVPGAKTTEELTESNNVVTTGDGLYADATESGRYIYKGANPNNYICLEELASGATCSADKLYRIISVETDGTLKIIKNTSIGELPWDLGYSSEVTNITTANSTNGTRYSNTSSDLCYAASSSSYNGCKSWANATNTYDSTGTTTTESMTFNAVTSDLPAYNAYLNAYLNGGDYLNTSNTSTTINGWYDSNGLTSNIKAKIDATYAFNIGIVTNSNSNTFTQTKTESAAYKWKGTVGLMSILDYVLASNGVSCTNTTSATDAGGNNCDDDNWLKASINEWTISPNDTSSAWNINSAGYAAYNNASTSLNVRPVMHLHKSVILKGTGTNDSNVYKIYIETS